LLELGALERIDADRIVHALVAPGTPVTQRVRENFGDGVIGEDGAVDRRRLADIVFADPERLRTLEAITHPAVRDSIRERLAELDGQDGVVVVDAVRLLQSDLLSLTEEVWVVTCAPRTQLQRLTETRHMMADEAHARMQAQPSFDHPRVARIFQNDGSRQELRQCLEDAWSSFIGSDQ
jgi:dephospho-CoA kinase